MPDLRLSWGDYPGGYGTNANGTATIDTGGVAVTVDQTAIAPGAEALTLALPTYDDPADDLPPDSQLKLFLEGGPAGDTSQTQLTFSSTDPLFGDAVTDLTFRIDDIDAGSNSDIDGTPGAFHEDIVEIVAFDAAGNAVPVTITPGAGMSLTGQTLDGTTQGIPTDAAQSALISIAGPVARVEINYANSGTGVQEILISDLLFTTTDPVDNNDPIAVDDTASTDFDTAITDIDVLGNDTDADPGDVLSLVPGSAATADGTVTENPDGTLNFTPAPGFTGPATITYGVTDGTGSDTGTLIVTVAPEDNADPVAVDDTATTTVDTLIEDIPVLANDSDADGDTLTVTGATAPNGTVTVNPDGTLDYLPDPGFTGTDTITYVISDGLGGTDVGSVAVTITDPASNEDPIAVNDAVTAATGVPLEDIPVLANDTDPDGDPLTVTGATAPNGTVTINPDGTLDYTSDPGFEGTDLITYVIDDGNGGTDTGVVRVSVRDDATPNDPPVAVDDTAAGTIDTVIPSIDVLGNDTDPNGDLLTVTGATAPNGTVVVNPDNTLSYTPDPGFTGADAISYTISDGLGGTDVGSVAVTITDPASNEDPVAANDAVTAVTGVPLEDIPVLANDTDPDGDPLTVISAASDNGGTVTINPDGTLDYTSPAGFEGTDLIRYTIDDGNGGTDDGVVRVSVRDTGTGNTAPTPVDDTAATPVDTLLEDIPVLANDSDPDGDPLTVTAATAPNGTVTINPDGTLDYQPDPGFIGPDTITYTVDDGNGGTVSAAVTVTVGTPPVNSLPVAVDDTAATPVDTLLEDIPVLANDSDPDGDPLTVTGATAPNGTVTINPDGTLDYLPDPGFSGTDTITYVIDDGISGTDVGTVTVTVGAVNDDPIADPDSSTTPLDTPVTIFPLGNDTDPDGDPLTVTAATTPDGTVTIAPDGQSVEYTPTPGFIGVASITYTIADGLGGTDTSSIQVIVDSTPLDGIVEGTVGDDFISADNPGTTPVDPYLGDPEGDQIDNSDAVIPGAGAEDDVVEAGDGDDTVLAGEGDDSVTAGAGDDSVDGGVGDDTVIGGDGLDTITTGDGSDSVLGGIDDDVIDTSAAIPLLDEAPFPSIPTDATPDNDLDFVDGGDGNDSITTGDDDDTIFGGEGDDTINPGIDDDSVLGGEGADVITDEQGSDYIEGNGGDDIINAGVDTFSDYIGDDPNLPVVDSGITFVTDPDQDDGRDTVFGGGGNDIINTGDDADSIDGGGDNDTINAGIDDDTVRGGEGDDSIFGGHGSDTISGGLGDDFIDAGHTGTPGYIGDVEDAFEAPGLELNDRDFVTGGSGNDTILGGDDDDSLSGGAGNDLIDGGIDDDTIAGDTGDDTIFGGDGDDSIASGSGSDEVTGGAGADSIFTGAGEDTILGATVGDTIDGGEGPVDFDILDLRGAGAAANPGGRVTVDYDAPGSEGGIVNFLDAADVVTGTARFDNIENVIPCFTPGTMIATPTGERAVETLEVGDKVITRDNGIQEIRWAGAKDMTAAHLAAKSHLQPVLIRAGALGGDMPERDILVSPQHRMLLSTDHAAMYFDEREVLVAAKYLTILDGVDQVESSGTTYIHIMFDQHEVVLSNGVWSESFQPGDYSLDGIGEEQRNEILEIFPELATQQGVDKYHSARRSLKKYEAGLLLG